ncbi:MAG: beta-ketoacyl synthase chain length factor [Gammaproteobacteria bacterium]|nr:beta-ketoacyl synthase chain length factor [Gammaproteobacteria bacterium]
MEKQAGELTLPISAWSAWAPGLESAVAWRSWAVGELSPGAEGSPSLSFVEPMLRRRLGRTARMALHVAEECTRGRESVRTVFASRHGELHRTVRMLRELSSGNEPSPTDFSLSVHNAAAGIYSITRRDHSPSIAVSASEESFGYGLIEAATQWLRDPSQAVLLVYADEPVPTEYRTFVDTEECPHALALLLAPTSDSPQAVVRLRRMSSTGERSPEMQSLAFLRSWALKVAQASWSGDRCRWEWGVA